MYYFHKKGGLIINSKKFNNLKKVYEKPNIYEEIIDIEDICGVSNRGTYDSENGNSASIFDLFPQD